MLLPKWKERRSAVKVEAAHQVALHIYPSSFLFDSRMRRITRSLVEADCFQHIHIGAMAAPGCPEIESLGERRTLWRVPLTTQKLGGTIGKVVRFLEWYLRLLVRFRRGSLDVVSCHSISVLPLGFLFNILRGCRIIYDTHELETETGTSIGFRRVVLRIMERSLIRRVEAVVVVSDSIGRWYRETYGLTNVYVVRNIPDDPPPQAVSGPGLREASGVPKGALLFLYQGVIGAGRGISLMLETFAQLPDDRHVVFLGHGPMVESVQEYAQRCPNIHYLPAVSPDRLSSYTAAADVGLVVTENTCLSHFYSLPNKFFEYIQAGIPMIASDYPELARIIDETECGWKSAVEPSAFLALIRSLSTTAIKAHAQSARVARTSFSWTGEAVKLVAMYETLDRARLERSGIRRAS